MTAALSSDPLARVILAINEAYVAALNAACLNQPAYPKPDCMSLSAGAIVAGMIARHKYAEAHADECNKPTTALVDLELLAAHLQHAKPLVAGVPQGWREHGDKALAHISNALDDLDSSPDQRPVPLLNEAMHCVREMLAFAPQPESKADDGLDFDPHQKHSVCVILDALERARGDASHVFYRDGIPSSVQAFFTLHGGVLRDMLEAWKPNTTAAVSNGLESGCVGIALHTLRETRAFVTGNAASRIDGAIEQIERLTGEGGAG